MSPMRTVIVLVSISIITTQLLLTVGTVPLDQSNTEKRELAADEQIEQRFVQDAAIGVDAQVTTGVMVALETEEKLGKEEPRKEQELQQQNIPEEQKSQELKQQPQLLESLPEQHKQQEELPQQQQQQVDQQAHTRTEQTQPQQPQTTPVKEVLQDQQQPAQQPQTTPVKEVPQDQPQQLQQPQTTPVKEVPHDQPQQAQQPQQPQTTPVNEVPQDQPQPAQQPQSKSSDQIPESSQSPLQPTALSVVAIPEVNSQQQVGKGQELEAAKENSFEEHLALTRAPGVVVVAPGEGQDVDGTSWWAGVTSALQSLADSVKQLKKDYVDTYIMTKLNHSETKQRRSVGTDL